MGRERVVTDGDGWRQTGTVGDGRGWWGWTGTGGVRW